jgi:hypothetical protein
MRGRNRGGGGRGRGELDPDVGRGITPRYRRPARLIRADGIISRAALGSHRYTSIDVALQLSLAPIKRLVAFQSSLSGVVMLDRDPLVFPSRRPDTYPYTPGVPDRQLWAIGMVVVQWGMTETLIEQQTRLLVGDDKDALQQYEKLRNARQRIDFFRSQIALKMQDPLRSRAEALVQRIQNLNAKRDNVIHRLWGGGMQAGTWASENYETTDAALLRQPGDKFKTKSTDARATIHWRLTFQELKQTATEMAILNRDLFQAFFLAPPPATD